MTIKQLSQILFVDIETVSLKPSYSQLSNQMQNLWSKKISYYMEQEDLSVEEAYQKRAGIYAEFGKVVVVSIGYFHEDQGILKFRLKAIADHDEEELLKKLQKIMDSGFNALCAHNGKEFDFPYLSRRYLINGLKLPTMLQLQGKKPWQVPHYDTLELWKFGDYKHFTSLEMLCGVFGIESSKSDLDGSKVSEVYHELGELKRIATYCNQDVVALAQVFLRLNQMETINEAQIDMLEE